MSLHRFFLENQVLADETDAAFPLRLNEGDMKHAQVLRLKAGEHIAVIDAVQDYFECEVIRFGEGLLEVRITQREHDAVAQPTVVLVQGIAKGDKMDQIIRQATEIGIGAFVPFTCERSVVQLEGKKAIARVQRWGAIAKSAAMQSGQMRIPEVTDPQDLDQVCSFIAQASVVLVFWEEEKTRKINEQITNALSAQRIDPADARVVVVVGPEGGLSNGEVAALLGANRFAGTVTLGPSILRTETAGVVASALVLYELGGLQ